MRNSNVLGSRVNEILAFEGIYLSANGDLKQTDAAGTLGEAQRQADRLKLELSRRNVHHDVLRFCRAELLDENYFHAILEASKSVAQKLRDRTGQSLDGAELVDVVFRLQHPLLAWTALGTSTERSEQAGFANLLKGMFSLFRNPTAHEPKVLKHYTEQEALDLLTLLSYFHRRIDLAHRTALNPLI